MAEQALDNSQPNLAAMFQNLPAIAAYQSGAQQGRADDNNELIQNAFNADQAHQVLKRPLDLANLMATTRVHNASADLTGQQAVGAGLANAFTGATQPGKITQTNAANEAGTVADKVKKLESQGQLYGQMAAQMDGMTPWERVALVKKHLGDQLPDHPAIEAGLMKNADTLHEWMAKLSDDSYTQSSAARKAQMDEDKKLKLLELAGENQRALEQMKIDGRFDMMKLKSSLTPQKAETMSQYEARLRNEASKGDVQAQLALQNLNSDMVAKAAASALVGDDLKRDVLKMGRNAPATPSQPAAAPTPSPAPIKSPVGGPSASGSDYPAILAQNIANGSVPEGAADGEVAKFNPAQRQVFLKELWISKAQKANPGMTREAIEAEGKKRNKF